MFEIIILSVVQGITEFLPISSSAHLIIVTEFFKIEKGGLLLDISLHSGSLLAIILYFKKDLAFFLKNIKKLRIILISSIPVVLGGYILVKSNLTYYLRELNIISLMTIIFAFFLYYADKKPLKKKISKDFNLKSFLIIGFFQVLSLVPGVSRSGITITAARLLHFRREDSAKISFLLSIPVLCAATAYNILSLSKIDNFDLNKYNLIAFILSFLFSFITIKYFINYIIKKTLTIFIIYRILIGILILFLIN